MSKQEMMRQSAKQKLAAEKHEREWTEALEETSERLDRLEEMISGLSRATEAQPTSSGEEWERLEELLETLLSRQTKIQLALKGLDPQQTLETSAYLLTSTNKAKENAKELGKVMKEVSTRLASATATSQKQSTQLREAVELLEKEPAMLRKVSVEAHNRIMKASAQMMDRLEKQLMFLGLKALGIGVACTILTVSLAILLGWALLENQDLEVEVMDKSERAAVESAYSLQRRMGEISEEDRKTVEKILYPETREAEKSER